jgi:hypothetical protein
MLWRAVYSTIFCDPGLASFLGVFRSRLASIMWPEGSSPLTWELTVVECAPVSCLLVRARLNEANCGLPTDDVSSGCNNAKLQRDHLRWDGLRNGVL